MNPVHNPEPEKSVLRKLLGYPGSTHENVDDPSVTYKRRETIRSKPFLHAIYQEWYGMQAAQFPAVSGAILEIGSGAGFFQELRMNGTCPIAVQPRIPRPSMRATRMR